MQGGSTRALLLAALVFLGTVPIATAQLEGANPPSADFTWAPESPIAGQDVWFHDTSKNGTKVIWKYEWYSGDGQYRRRVVANISMYKKTPPDVPFNYSEPGTYDVTLKVTDRAAHEDEKTQTIVVRPGLTTTFALSQQDTTVSVDAAGTSSPYGAIASYTWVWGDGTPNSTGVRATHTYRIPGQFPLKLVVADEHGNPGKSHQTVLFVDPGPAVGFLVEPGQPAVGKPVTFTDASTPSRWSALASWTWKVDGVDAGSGPALTRTFDETGTYNVTLNVTDARGKYNVTTRAIRVLSPPTPLFALDQDDRSVTVDAAPSLDRDGEIVSYAWDWGDGQTGEGVGATHEYVATGTYVVTLTVTDDDGATATANRTVDVVGRPVAVAFSAEPGVVEVGHAIAFVDGSVDPEGAIQAWRWEFGDGTTGEGAQATHAYGQPGRFVVNLTVTDSQGGLARATRTVTVEAPPPPPPTPVTPTPDVPTDAPVDEPPTDVTPVISTSPTGGASVDRTGGASTTTTAAPTPTGGSEVPAPGLVSLMVAIVAVALVLRRR